MPLVSSSIPNLVNGVSQQPATLRLASQCEVQENGLSTTAQGLKKRPPTKHIKRLSDSLTGSAFIHTINRDTSEQYEVVVTNGDLKVYDMSGNEKTVAFPNGKGYLSSADPSTSFRAVTVADYTFILNKNVVVTQSATLSPARPHEALVFVKSGQYAKAYQIFINGVAKAFLETPDGSDPAHGALISTDTIASQLASSLTTNGITNSVAGSVIHVTQPADFTITTYDGYNNNSMLAIKGKVQRFSDLPTNPRVSGFAVEVAGDPSTTDDNYWVTFDTTDNSTGVWKESIKPAEKVGFTASTMPMALVRLGDGTFEFKILPWANRLVGDLNSAPDPSFVGKPIRDIFFYRNRLGFLADESVIFSEAGEFFNFYPTTVTTLLDSDPIDVAASHTKVSILNFAVPFNKELLLFSSQTQFSVNSGDILTPKTVSIKPTTEFECNPKAAPVGVGRNVYFAVPRGDFEGVREYFVTSDSDTEDAADVTSHVPKYIPKGVFKIAAALNEDTLCFLTTSERNVIYVYKFYWNNNEKLQSSWSRWVFPETDQILHAEFLESELFLVINRPDGLYLESMNVAPGEVLGSEPYVVHLDRKKEVTGVNFGPVTALPLGWVPNDGEYVAVVATGQTTKAGVVLDVLVDGEGSPYVNGNYDGVDFIVGRKYTFRYKFSPLMIRTNSQQGQKADTVGRLQVRNMQVNFSETGHFQAKVTPFGRDTYTYVYTGKTLGVPSASLGAYGIEDGKFHFSVQSQNTTVDIELVSDSPLPCAFMSADWEGYYVRRSEAV